MENQKANIQIEKALLYQLTFRFRKKNNFQEDYDLIENGKILSDQDKDFSSALQSEMPAASELSSLRKSYQKAYEKGVRWVFPNDPDYPFSFKNIEEPPSCLSYLGKALWKTHDFFSVVGNREPSSESLIWMETELGSFLEQNTVGIVSGGARGVDQMAHRLCLQKGRPTLAFLPSGLAKPYPSNLLDWLPWIHQGQMTLLSEYPLFQTMKKYFFHDRNRLISNLGLCTLLIEARRKSGTMVTAQRALEQNKTVMVLPAHPLDPKAQGGLDLLYHGAAFIRDSQDIQILFNSERRWSELMGNHQ